MEKLCGFCIYHDEFTWVCFNGNSQYCADYIAPDRTCRFWESIQDNEDHGKRD